MDIRDNNVIFLLGAGCSFEAGIPLSIQMVNEIHSLISTNSKWTPYEDLYYYLRSAIQFSEGIHGKFDSTFNVEKLLTIMTELEKREKNSIYPFIGGWNSRLLDVAGPNFEKIKQLRELIREKLFDWLIPRHHDKGIYYKGFGDFKQTIGCPIRIFTLNHDLLFEKTLSDQFNIEQGFDKADHKWDYSNFEQGDHADIHFFLYKLHGSVDWLRDDSSIIQVDNHTNEADIIFGIEGKLKSEDPYLYYASELRKWTLSPDCKLIISIGYSHSDDYINRLLGQSLKKQTNRKLLVVGPVDDGAKTAQYVATQIGMENCDQIAIKNETASSFLSSLSDLNNLSPFFGADKEAPF